MDPSREVPEEIKIIDLQKKMKKKRYDLKYNLEQEYRVINKIQDILLFYD